MLTLRSSPTLEGRCCDDEVDTGGGRHVVAILTDPGGPVLRDVAGDGDRDLLVAILTDPGGPVLLGLHHAGQGRGSVLRSSPTLEGRCCSGRSRRAPWRWPGSCDPHRPWRAGAAWSPARPGGP